MRVSKIHGGRLVAVTALLLAAPSAAQLACATSNYNSTFLFNGTSGSVSIPIGFTSFNVANSCPNGYGDNVTIGVGQRHARVVQINLLREPPIGSTLYVETCGGTAPATVNTTLFVGRGCPATDWINGFQCIRGAVGDAGALSPTCAGKSQLWVPLPAGFTQTSYFVYVAATSTLPNVQQLRFSWQLLLPGPVSESPTPSGTPTPSMTPTVSLAPFCDGSVWSPTRVLGGTAGVWNSSTANASSANVHNLGGFCPDNAAAIPAYQPPGAGVPNAHVLSIDIGFTPPQWPAPSATLTIDTCRSVAFDALMFVGTGCGIDMAAFNCIASNDDWEGGMLPDGTFCASGAPRLIVPVRYRVTNVMIISRDTVNGFYSLRWSYDAASGTPTASVSPSWSSTNTPDGTLSPSRTTTPTSTATLTRGISASSSPGVTLTGTGTPAGTPAATGSPTVTRSPSGSITPSIPPSASVTPPVTQTRTASPSATPQCIAPRITFTQSVVGWAGNISGTTELSRSLVFDGPTQAGYADPWTCVDDADTSQTRSLPPGNKHVFSIDLGAGTPLGGLLTIDSCNSDSLFDTLLFVGSGCPANATQFTCLSASDDSLGCAPQSQVNVFPVTTRTYYAILGGYNGAFGPYRLTWRYSGPSPSESPSASPVPTTTPPITATSTRNVSPSGTPPGTPSITGSQTASITPSGTRSNAGTPRITPSSSETPGICGMGESNAYLTARLSGLSGAFTGNLDGQEALFRFGNCPMDGGGYQLLKNAPQVFLAVDVGANSPTSGFYVFDTCNGTDFDTLLFVGTGCPSLESFSTMQCVMSNEDACGIVIDDRQVNSRVVLPVIPSQRYYYVMINAYAGATVGTYTLNWRWSDGVEFVPSPFPQDPDFTPTQTPSIPRSSTASPSSRPSPTSTATNRLVGFETDSVLVIRVGGAVYSAAGPGTALPVVVSELHPVTGALRGAIPLATSSDGVNQPCALSYGTASPSWLYEQEGLPSMAGNRGSVSFPCYAQGPGQPLSVFADKVVASIEFGAYADTSRLFFGFNGLPDATQPQALRTAATQDSATSGWYVGGVGGTPLYHGIRWVRRAAGTSSDALATAYNPVYISGRLPGHPGYSDVRYLSVVGGVLTGSSSRSDGFGVTGVFASRVGSPVIYAGTNFSSLPGFAGASPMSPFSFVIDGDTPDSSTSLWLAVEHGRPAYNVIRYARNGVTGVWAATADTILFDAVNPVYSIAGRFDNDTGAMVLWAVTRSTLYRFDTSIRGSPAVVATAGVGEYFRGVAMPPQMPVPASATPPPSPSQGAVPSTTGTGTPTPSVTRSPTPTSTPSSTASAPLVSPTPSGSAGATPSITSSGSTTATATVEPTSSETSSPTGTPTPTTSNTNTVTSTSTASGTPPITASSTGSITDSATQTSSAGAIPSVTPSGTGTPTDTPTVTPTATLTPSGTGAAVTPSGSGSAGASATGTPAGTPAGAETPSGTGTSTGTPVPPSGTPTGTGTGTVAPTPPQTPSGTGSNSPTPSITPSNSPTPSLTPTGSITTTPGSSRSGTPTGSATVAGTPSSTASGTMAPSQTGSLTGTTSITQTLSFGTTPSVTPSFPPPASMAVSLSITVSSMVGSMIADPNDSLSHQLRADVACAFNASYSGRSRDARVFIVAARDLQSGAWLNASFGAASVHNALPLRARGRCDEFGPDTPGLPAGYLDSPPGTLIQLSIEIPPPPVTDADLFAGLNYGYAAPADFWYSQAYRRQLSKARAVADAVNATVSTPSNGFALSGNPSLFTALTAFRGWVSGYAYGSVARDDVRVSVDSRPAFAAPPPRLPLVSVRPPPEKAQPRIDTTTAVAAGAGLGGAVAVMIGGFLLWLVMAKRRSTVARKRSVVTMSLDDYLKYAVVKQSPGRQIEAAVSSVTGSGSSQTANAAAGSAASAWGAAGIRELKGEGEVASANPLTAATVAALPSHASAKLASFDSQYRLAPPPQLPPPPVWLAPLPPTAPPSRAAHRPERASAHAASVEMGWGLDSGYDDDYSSGGADFASPMHAPGARRQMAGPAPSGRMQGAPPPPPLMVRLGSIAIGVGGVGSVSSPSSTVSSMSFPPSTASPTRPPSGSDVSAVTGVNPMSRGGAVATSPAPVHHHHPVTVRQNAPGSAARGSVDVSRLIGEGGGDDDSGKGSISNPLGRHAPSGPGHAPMVPVVRASSAAGAPSISGGAPRGRGSGSDEEGTRDFSSPMQRHASSSQHAPVAPVIRQSAGGPGAFSASPDAAARNSVGARGPGGPLGGVGSDGGDEEGSFAYSGGVRK